MPFTELFVEAPGQTNLYAFPASASYALATWATHRVLVSEVQTGLYSATCDDAKSTKWLVFVGATQPANMNEAIYYPNRPPLIMHEVIGHGYFGWNHAYGAELEKARASAWAEAANYGYKDVAEDGSNHLQVSFLYAFVDNYFSNQHFHIWHAIMNDPSLDVYGKLWSPQLGFDITYH